MNTSTALLKSILSRGSYLDGIERDALARLLPLLEDAHDEVLARVAKAKKPLSQAWFAAVAADLQDIYESAARQALDDIEPVLEDLAKNEGAWMVGELGTAAVGVSFTAPAPSLLSAVTDFPTSVQGSTLENLFLGLADNARKVAYEAIQASMLEGETVDDFARRFRGEVVSPAQYVNTKTGKRIVGVSKRDLKKMVADGSARYLPGVYKDGAVEGVTTAQARSLARTAAMHVSNQARELVLKANADIFKGYQYVATLDLRTCPVCGNDDGRVYGLNEPRPQLPRHVGDRCCYVPVLKSWQELGLDGPSLPPSTRASMDGQVAETVTYADRLKAASHEKRVEMLGLSRANLYEHGVPLSAMVEGGRTLTLDEIADRRRKGAA